MSAESNLQTELHALGRRARGASRRLAALRPEVKNSALEAMAQGFLDRSAEIIAENAKDLESGKAKGLSAAMLDRLALTEKRIAQMAEGVAQVARLDDPVGQVYDMKTRPNGIRVGRMRVPIGVVGIIYESRPNVTADAGALCVKSGNACILRGGSEAIHSNRVLARVMDEAGAKAGLPEGAVQVVQTTDRAAVLEMLKMPQYVDLVIPRGGKSLIEMVVRESLMPVIKHYDGICYVYVDESADLDAAERIIINSKTQRTGVCNAQEALLVHRSIAEKFLPRIGAALKAKNVEMRADSRALPSLPGAIAASEADFSTEFLDLILAVGVIDGIDDAINWINDHGSHHTDVIVTNDHTNAMRFLNEVDSACVHVNCSTRFSDGGEYGMGCEIGISTDKLHARGPMGLIELTSSKFIVFGDGQVRG